MPITVTPEDNITPFFQSGQEPVDTSASPQVPEATAHERSQQYAWGLGNDSPGTDTIKNDLMAGRESLLREAQASIMEMRSFSDKQENTQRFLDSKIGQPLAVEDVKYLHELNQQIAFPEKFDPSSVFEKKYADQVLREATQFPQEDDQPFLFTSALDMMKSRKYYEDHTPSEVVDYQNMQVAHDFLTKRMMYGKIAEDLQEKYKSEGYFSAAIDIAKQLVPGYRYYQQKDALTDTEGWNLDGSGTAESINELYSGKYTPEQGAALVKEKLDAMYSRNPAMAVEMSRNLLDYSDSNQMIDLVSNVLDASVAGSVGKALLTRALKGATSYTTIAGIKDLTGQQADAALRDVITQATKASQTTGASKDSLKNLFGVIQPFTNPDVVLKDANLTRFSTGFASNLADMLKNYGAGLIKATVLDPLNVTRIVPGTEAYKQVLTEAQETIARVYPRTNQSIMSIEPMRSVDNAITNNDVVRFHVGKPGGEAFETAYQAKQAARRYGLKDYNVVDVGGKNYAIAVDITADETLPSIKNAIRLDVQNVQTPDSATLKAVDFFRIKDKFVAQDINQELKTAAGGVQKLSSISKNILNREISGLNNRNLSKLQLRNTARKDLSDFLIHQQDNQQFSKSLLDFETDWSKFHGRFPTEQEARAYFAVRVVNDAEFLNNNLRAYTMKAREGLMNHQFSLKGLTSKDLPWVEGKIVKEIPWDLGDDAGILVWPNKTNSGFVYGRKEFTKASSKSSFSRQGVDDLIQNQGYKVVNVSKYGQEALRQFAKDQGLKDFPKGRIDYVVVKNTATKNLSFEHIPYKPGGHYFYRDPYFISQGRVVTTKHPGGEITNDYLGDRNWFSARTRAEAVYASQRLEEIRQLLVAGDRVGAKASLARSGLPLSYSDIRQAFNPRNDFLDLRKPIQWRSAGGSVEDEHKISTGYRNFNQVETSTHNVLNDDVLFRYGQEKGARLSGIYNVGSQEAPIWSLQPSRLVDPYNAVRRSSNSIAASRFMDDLKIKAADRFAQEFSKVLKDPAGELSRFPLRALMNPDIINKAHADKALVAKAQNYRRAVLEFLQTEPQDVTRGNALKERILGRITGLDKQETAINVLERLTSSNPQAFLRYWAGFIPNMGLWNPKQLFMQAQGITVTASIEGWGRMTKSAGMGWHMRQAMVNGSQQVIDEAAKQAFKHWGIKPKHFKESLEGMQKTDFWRVGDNWADVNDIVNSTNISTARNVADSSLYFFNKGERANKITAWNASYLKWREANPIIPFKGNAVKEVLEYADFLTMNMTRASAAANQVGGRGLQSWASVPTQFWSYQTRLMDAMLSPNSPLSTAQKLKFMGYQSLLYGIPIGTLGTALGGIMQPSQMVSKFMAYEGWDPKDPISQSLLNGIPQMLFNMATGADQNIAQTLGPNGLSVIPDILGSSDLVPGVVKSAFGAAGREDKDGLLDLLVGASGKKVKQVIDASSPLAGYLLNQISPESASPYTSEDFVGVLQAAGVTNNALKAVYAWNMGTYFTRQGKAILPENSLGVADALSMFILGSMPNGAQKFYEQIESDKARQEAQSFAKTKAMAAYKRAMQEGLSDEDIQDNMDNAHKWMILGDFTYTQRADILREAVSPQQDQLTKLEKKIQTGTASQYQRWLEKAEQGNREE